MITINRWLYRSFIHHKVHRSLNRVFVKVLLVMQGCIFFLKSWSEKGAMAGFPIVLKDEINCIQFSDQISLQAQCFTKRCHCRHLNISIIFPGAFVENVLQPVVESAPEPKRNSTPIWKGNFHSQIRNFSVVSGWTWKITSFVEKCWVWKIIFP